MRLANVKRSVVINGHHTSITLEDAFWSSLRDIAAKRGCTVSALVTQIDSQRTGSNLSSAIRVYVFEYFKASSEHAVEQ